MENEELLHSYVNRMEARDAFYEPQPHPSWILNETTCIWYPPIAYPDDGKDYTWNEATTNWVEIEE